MRGLDQSFVDDLQTGLLAPFLQRVQCDHTICLEIREQYVNLYYRGGNLLRIGTRRGTYQAEFDLRYTRNETGTPPLDLSDRALTDDGDIAAWLGLFPRLKLSMDLYFGRHPKLERENDGAQKKLPG